MTGARHQTAVHAAAHQDGRPWLSIAALAAMIVIRIVDPSTMERLRLAYFDLQQSAWPRSLEGRRVVIVDVDEASLIWVGQWPWPRSTVARLTSAIAAMRPAVIGFDVLFPEPDRLSPQQIVRTLPSIDPVSRLRLLSLPSNDALLADSFRRIPVVLAMVALPATAAIGNSSGTTPVSLVAEAGADARGSLARFASLITNITELDAAASGRGVVTLAPDEDGVLRRSAAAIVVRERIFPSLAVEMARVAARADGITLVADDLGIDAVRVGDDRFPTDEDGNLWLHYARPHSLQVVSAADILAGRISASIVQGKFVLVGTTAVGISDHHATPVGDRRSGVEIHAQLLQNLMDGDILVRPAYLIVGEVMLMVFVGIVSIAAARRLRGWRLLPLFAGLLVLVFCVAIFAYVQARVLIDPTFTAALAIVLYMSAVTEGVLAEERARRRTEDRLRQALLRAETASKAKTDFLANMSHELRTPLTAILGFSDAIKNQLFGPILPAKYRDYVDRIHASGEHLLAVVSDVLDMSRIEAGEAKLEESDIDLAEAAGECLRMLGPRIEKKRLQVRLEVDAAMPHLRADRRMVKQMLLNLLANAVTYTPEGGSVTLAVRMAQDREVVIAVRDTGIGIAKPELSRIMEPFQIVEDPRARSYQGVGLGLPLTRSLVQLHGGALTLESEVGSGTTATLTFPAARTA
jgi:signal transduction histidine kinase